MNKWCEQTRPALKQFKEPKKRLTLPQHGNIKFVWSKKYKYRRSKSSRNIRKLTVWLHLLQVSHSDRSKCKTMIHFYDPSGRNRVVKHSQSYQLLLLFHALRAHCSFISSSVWSHFKLQIQMRWSQSSGDERMEDRETLCRSWTHPSSFNIKSN